MILRSVWWYFTSKGVSRPEPQALVDTGLWLVGTDHVTRIPASDWLVATGGRYSTDLISCSQDQQSGYYTVRPSEELNAMKSYSSVSTDRCVSLFVPFGPGKRNNLWIESNLFVVRGPLPRKLSNRENLLTQWKCHYRYRLSKWVILSEMRWCRTDSSS